MTRSILCIARPSLCRTTGFELAKARPISSSCAIATSRLSCSCGYLFVHAAGGCYFTHIASSGAVQLAREADKPPYVGPGLKPFVRSKSAIGDRVGCRSRVAVPAVCAATVAPPCRSHVKAAWQLTRRVVRRSRSSCVASFVGSVAYNRPCVRRCAGSWLGHGCCHRCGSHRAHVPPKFTASGVRSVIRGRR